jgi:chromosome segregation ATPase
MFGLRIISAAEYASLRELQERLANEPGLAAMVEENRQMRQQHHELRDRLAEAEETIEELRDEIEELEEEDDEFDDLDLEDEDDLEDELQKEIDNLRDSLQRATSSLAHAEDRLRECSQQNVQIGSELEACAARAARARREADEALLKAERNAQEASLAHGTIAALQSRVEALEARLAAAPRTEEVDSLRAENSRMRDALSAVSARFNDHVLVARNDWDEIRQILRQAAIDGALATAVRMATATIAGAEDSGWTIAMEPHEKSRGREIKAYLWHQSTDPVSTAEVPTSQETP